MPIWLHASLAATFSTLVPPAVIIFILTSPELKQALGITEANSPTPILLFFGIPLLSKLMFTYGVKAK